MGSIAVLKGNLAPEGAVVKYSACEKSMRSHKGRAVVFDCEEDAIHAILTHAVHPGEAVFIRYEGPKGSGMPEMFYYHRGDLVGPGARPKHRAHHRRPFLRCDSWRSHRSRFSGAVNGGTIAYVQDGDIISIDIPNHSIQLEVSDEELAERKKTTKILVKENLTGYLKRYSKMVSSADKGAIINRMD